ncbi:hypothetical protein LTR15_012548 [Elasticomyces elasticus]|nr:hypothetical protein LTR15_012548 [Elasticomyces elasticus]
MAPPTRPRGSYMVGIICALDVEKAAMDAMLDEEHGGVAPMEHDNNYYSFGRMGQHDVVIACLPAGVMGKASAATVAKDMMRSFPIKVGFMVGIGGGVPNDTKDVRLGDVVVSEPTGMHGGVVQWDFGKREKEGFQRKYTLNKPPLPLLSALSILKSNRRRLGSGVHLHFQEMISKFPPMQEEYSSPGQEHDILFEAGYPHESGNTCVDCDRSRRIQRPQRKDDEPRTHYGNIASGDQVVKDGPFRDHIAQQEGIICFEMEAAGLMDNFPCVVIRGICDYADSHLCRRYLAFYDKTWTTLMGLQYPLQDYREESVLTTWRMSYERVGAVDPQATAILDQWAFLDAGDIWYELATSRPPYPGNGGASEDGALEDSISEDVTIIATDKLKFLHSLEVLCSYSLVVADIEGTGFSIHPVVHAWCLHNAARGEMQEQLRDRALEWVVAMIPDDFDDGHWNIARRLTPHARVAAARHLEGAEKEDFNDEIVKIAGFLNDWASSADVELLYLRALNSYVKVPGEDHTSTLDTLNMLGVFYWGQGKIKEAEEMFWRALRGDLEAWGSKYTPTDTTVAAFSNLGTLYVDQGKMKDAEDMYSRALSIGEKVLGPGHATTTISLTIIKNLGNLYIMQGRIEEGAEMFVRALQGFEEALGTKHPAILSMVGRLGSVYADHGRYEEAEEMCTRALHGLEEAWGAKHMRTLDAVSNLGSIYDDQGRYEEAEEMSTRAVQGLEETRGAKHMWTLAVVSKLGTIYTKQGRYKEAEEMYVRALEGFEEMYGPKYRTTLKTVRRLGSLYHDQGELLKARTMYTRAAEGYEHAVGEHEAAIHELRESLAALRKEERQRVGKRSRMFRFFQKRGETSTLDESSSSLYSRALRCVERDMK